MIVVMNVRSLAVCVSSMRRGSDLLAQSRSCSWHAFLGCLIRDNDRMAEYRMGELQATAQQLEWGSLVILVAAKEREWFDGLADPL